MTLTFICPSCNAPLDYDGKELTIRCPYCNNSVIVPEELRSGTPQVSGFEGQVSQFLSADMDLNALVGQASQFKEIVELARQGKKIEAIKLYRKLTGLGLKESKDAIDALVAGQSITISTATSPGVISVLDDQIEFSRKSAALDQVNQLVQQGKKIEAIKLYRETFDTGLAKSKAAVDRIEAGELTTVRNMALQSPYTPQIIVPKALVTGTVATGAVAAGGIGCFVWLIVVVVGLSVIIPLFFALASRNGPLSGLWQQVNPISFARLSSSFGGEGSGQGLFDDPRSVAVDGQGFIYVGEYSDGRIQRFNSAGEFQSLWNIGDKSYLGGMAASQDGTVYLVYKGAIQRFEGSTGASLGPLEFADDYSFHNLALAPDGRLVAVSNGEEILRFDRNNQPDLVIPAAISSLSGDSELDTRIAVDGLGNIYALGTFNEAVFKFSPDGRFITRFGSEGDEKGQFSAPSAITVDGQGRIDVSDFKGIQVFDADGRYLDKIPADGFVFGMTINANNQLVAVSNQHKVLIYTLP